MNNAAQPPDVGPIDAIIDRIDGVVDWAGAHSSPLGYFAVLYRLVTRNIRDAVARGGVFDDDARMVTFDIRFAERFLQAVERWHHETRTTEAWSVALAATRDPGVTVMQHLMLGINAHMNLDLPVVAASLAVDRSLESLRADFLRINQILGDLVGPFEAAVGKVSPRLGEVEHFAPDLEGKLFDWGLVVGRDVAWHDAESIVAAGPLGRDARIGALDHTVADLGRDLWHLPAPLAEANAWVGERESKDVAHNLQALGRVA